jgi:hypothetical protein
MRHVWQVLVVVIALAVGGCASTSKTYDAQGREAYTLNCSGWARSWAMCQEKAGNLCGSRGYTVTAQSEEPLFAGGILTSSRTMMVTCRGQ